MSRGIALKTEGSPTTPIIRKFTKSKLFLKSLDIYYPIKTNQLLVKLLNKSHEKKSLNLTYHEVKSSNIIEPHLS